MTTRPLVVLDFIDTIANVEGGPKADASAPIHVYDEVRPILHDLAGEADLAVIHSGADAKTVQVWLGRTGMDTSKWRVFAGDRDFESLALDALSPTPLGTAGDDQRLLLYVSLNSYRRWIMKSRLDARPIHHPILAKATLAALASGRDARIGYFIANVPMEPTGAGPTGVQGLVASFSVAPIAIAEEEEHLLVGALATVSTIERLHSEPLFPDVGDCDIVEICTDVLTPKEEEEFVQQLSFRDPPKRRGNTLLVAMPGDPRLSLPHPPRAPHGHGIVLLPLRPHVYAFKKQPDLDPQPLAPCELEKIKALGESDYDKFFKPVCGLEDLYTGSGRLGLNRTFLDSKSGNRDITHYLKAVMETLLVGVPDSSVTLHCFEDGGVVHSNVEARIGPNTCNEIVVLGAHFDSFADWVAHCPGTKEFAPGADDDASGVAGVLLALQTIAGFAKAKSPRRQIRFLLFNAEEYLMLGSRLYVSSLAPATEIPVAMIELDMIGWIDSRNPERFAIHGPGSDYVSLQAQSGKIADVLEESMDDIAKGYVAERLGSSEKDLMAIRSDHRSFYMNGYPGCLLMELGNPVHGKKPADPLEFNPRYHTECDRFLNHDPIDGKKDDYCLAIAITKVAIAGVWRLAKKPD